MSREELRRYYEERYDTQGGETFPADPSRYRAWFGSRLARECPGAAMLDFGCGVGYVCTMFTDLGYNVTGVDISPAALRIAREREPRANFLEARPDGTLPFPDASFDLVACLGVLEHVSDPSLLVAELGRVSRRGADGLWVVPNAHSPFFWFGHGTGQIEEHPRTLDGWRRLLAGGGWTVTDVRRDPGPIDRPIAGWKRAAQGLLNRLPLRLTYQFVIETRAA